MSAVTPGMVCSHHHLYSALARGMPAPPRQPTKFIEILEQVWWRLDVALDEEMIRWSAMLAAVEALQCGTTAIVDHHESPSATVPGALAVGANSETDGLPLLSPVSEESPCRRTTASTSTPTA